jgi:hypothetical protein
MPAGDGGGGGGGDDDDDDDDDNDDVGEQGVFTGSAVTRCELGSVRCCIAQCNSGSRLLSLTTCSPC